MDDKTFEDFRKLIYDQCGIFLGPAKKTLVMGRVRKRMRALEITDFSEYFRHATRDAAGAELIHLLDAISTNVTFFFREPAHFRLLEETFTQRLRQGHRRFRIWSAGCSSGEEPYSIATVLLAAAKRCGAKDVDMKILATDLSTRVLSIARSGEYPMESLQSIPETYRKTLLRPKCVDEGHGLEIADEVRQIVTFRRLNLAKPPFPMRGPFDVIFCRNVMIYFDDDGRRRLVEQFEHLLRPGGLLMVGHTESAIAMLERLEYFQPSVYRKDDGIRPIASRISASARVPALSYSCH